MTCRWLVPLVATSLTLMAGCGCPNGDIGDDLPDEPYRCRFVPASLDSYDITGRYEYVDGDRRGAPVIELRADGTGLFQLHGATPQEMDWSVLGNSAGPVEIDRFEENFRYIFAWKTKEDAFSDCSATGSVDGALVCNPENDGEPVNDPGIGTWDEDNFTFLVTDGKALILGEREKALTPVN